MQFITGNIEHKYEFNLSPHRMKAKNTLNNLENPRTSYEKIEKTLKRRENHRVILKTQIFLQLNSKCSQNTKRKPGHTYKSHAHHKS